MKCFIDIVVLILNSCVTSGKFLNFSGLSVLIREMMWQGLNEFMGLAHNNHSVSVVNTGINSSIILTHNVCREAISTKFKKSIITQFIRFFLNVKRLNFLKSS